MSELTIAVDARTCLEANPRGEGRSIERLYREIAAIEPDWQLRFFGESTARAERLRWRNSRVRAFGLPGHRCNSWENLGLPLAATLAGCTVLHCTSSTAPAWSPLPFVVTVHDVIPLVTDDGWLPADVARFRIATQRAVNGAAAVIAVSESTRQDLIREFGLAADRVRVVHWGADPVAPTAPAAAVALRQGQGIARAYLLHLGGTAPRKNTAECLRGFAVIAAARPELDLVVTGLGESVRARHQALAESLGIGDRVHLLGYVDDELLAALYEGARALLYLSRYEGFGLPLLEAMAHGVPVVAADRSSIPEVVGSAALLVEPDDRAAWTQAVLDLLASPARLAVLAERGRARVTAFSWRRAAEQTAQILIDAAGRKRPPAKRRAEGDG